MSRYWRSLVIIILTPLLLLPLPFIIKGPESNVAYCVLLMAVYWVAEVIPIGVTAMLPVFMFPMLGVMKAEDVAPKYMSDLIMLFLGGMLMAVAIERWNLHSRIALRILLLVGSEPRWLMLGMMVATWFLSMWISNTATTAMMIPIVEAILQQLQGHMTDSECGREDDMSDMDVPVGKLDLGNLGGAASNKAKKGETAKEKQYRLFGKGLSLCVCYAANSGGIGTLTGTGPNMVLKRAADNLYSSKDLTSPVTFATWMGLGVPLSICILIVCWVWLQVVFLRCQGLTDCCSSSDERKAQGQRIRATVLAEYNKLGPVSFAEKAVLFWFVILVILWVFRDLGGVGGWGNLFRDGFVKDSTPAMLIGFLLFIFPARLSSQRTTRSPGLDVDSWSSEISVDGELDADSKPRPLLVWSEANAKIPWSLVFLLGGGFALSDGCKVSGLSAWVGSQLEVLQDMNTWGILFILCFMSAFLTEMTSNTAISILMMPILSTLAERTGVHPLYYMFPGALSCSFAFMLPVATPPNAIAFSFGRLKILDMALTGFVMNLLAVPILVLAIESVGVALFDLHHGPAAFFNESILAASES